MATIHAKAIGGGIDAPRSCNVMIAEEQASFVYPEIKFNHFPITAVAILSRRMGQRAAETMLLSGEEMSAAAFMAAGALEAVVPTGTGEAWLRKYAAESLPVHAAKTALFSAFNRRSGDLREELDLSRPDLDGLHDAPEPERDLQAPADRRDAGPDAGTCLSAHVGSDAGAVRRLSPFENASPRSGRRGLLGASFETPFPTEWLLRMRAENSSNGL